jgi:hypothetical protein
MVYLDSSTVLRVLRQPRPLALRGRCERPSISELLGVEERRLLACQRLETLLDDAGVAQAHEDLRAIERSIGRVALTRAVLQRAALPMPTVVKTLDGIHLATALLLRERRNISLTFATHDDQQATAARALGFDFVGV